MDVEGVERIADLVGDSRREQGDGRETLALDGLLGLLALRSDVSQDDGPAHQGTALRVGLVAHQRSDVEVQEAPFGIEDLEITAHHIAASGHGVEVESGDRRREIPAHVLRAGEAEERAGRPVHVDDVILRVGDDDPLQNGVEDRLEEPLLLGEDLEVVPEVGRFDKADPLDKLVDESPVHQLTGEGWVGSSRSSPSSATRRSKRSSAALTGWGEFMSTPASASVSIGNLLPPLLMKPK